MLRNDTSSLQKEPDSKLGSQFQENIFPFDVQTFGKNLLKSKRDKNIVFFQFSKETWGRHLGVFLV